MLIVINYFNKITGNSQNIFGLMTVILSSDFTATNNV